MPTGFLSSGEQSWDLTVNTSSNLATLSRLGLIFDCRFTLVSLPYSCASGIAAGTLMTPFRLDGGVKRIRVHGRRASQYPSFSSLSPIPHPKDAIPTSNAVNGVTGTFKQSLPQISVPHFPALPLTGDAFSKYGSVIQSYPDHRSARKDVVIKPVNFGTAFKFNHLAPVTFVQPPSDSTIKGEINFCVFRCEPQDGVVVGDSKSGLKNQWEIKALERHEFSSQSFVPMGGGGGRYLVVVALPKAGELVAAFFGCCFGANVLLSLSLRSRWNA